MDHASKGLALVSANLTFTDLSLGGTCSRSGKDILMESITLRNLSGTEATAVVVGGRLPAGVTFVSDSLQKCSVVGSLLSCSIGNVPGMSSIPFEIRYRVSFGNRTKLQQQLRISSNQYETVQTVTDNDLIFNQICKH